MMKNVAKSLFETHVKEINDLFLSVKVMRKSLI